ncbi:MAG: tRNA uridine-5-carboxymethylaminomethyl(34) synthesis enzyme MnmG [Bacilli bacterium]|nr:tRNA uridine-5-carboxymethylaminomethyl(34) synthesis enzyme MnmG [Bacilli bacterium]
MKRIIIVGGGHAGIEATLAVARLGFKATLITLDINNIGSMPCNPSIGGPAKGVVVREIDALGGEMAKATDATYLQMKMLNTAKGPGVQCLRAQSDKIEYARYMQRKLMSTKNVEIIEKMAVELIVENQKCIGVMIENGDRLFSDAVILTTGTYLNGKILRGHDFFKEGPDHQRSAVGLSESLRKNGFEIMRLKTGTPPRIKKDSVDYSNMEVQPGTPGELAFSYSTKTFIPLEKQHICYLIHTTPLTHNLIKENLKESAMYGGMVEGVGPRYCPSIEDKIVKFADKERHQLFIEPESIHLDTIYLQGFSTSMPVEIQDKMIRSLPGFANCEVVKYAYAIEYDAISPLQLKLSLETKLIENLFCAGQINGTSGYEEAAGQGLIAGINAVQKLNSKKPLILRRDEAYIGLMIDDLVIKGTQEPYRLLTSRSEYRLLLRHDNADIRLKKYGHDLGLISDDDYKEFNKKIELIDELIKKLKEEKFNQNHKINEYLEKVTGARLTNAVSAYDIIKRPHINLEDVLNYMNIDKKYSKEIHQQVEIFIKYEGYIKKQVEEAKEREHLEKYQIDENIDYDKIDNLAIEARQKLKKIRPMTIGQASRISGVNPSDIGILLMNLKIRGKK